MSDRIEIVIWEKSFSLLVRYDCYDDEEVLSSQIDALSKWVMNSEYIEKSKKKVQDYCRQSVLDDRSNKKKEDIFSYVKPIYVYIEREQDKPRVALMCDYRYDPEHGIAIVYSQNGNIEVGIQDIIL